MSTCFLNGQFKLSYTVNLLIVALTPSHLLWNVAKKLIGWIILKTKVTLCIISLDIKQYEICLIPFSSSL